MKNETRYEAAEQHLLRIEQFVDIAACIATDCFESPRDAVEELLDELANGEGPHADPSMLPLIKVSEQWKEYPDEIAGALGRAGLTGFAIQFATPRYISAHKDSRAYSWGACYLHWVYGNTLKEAWTAAIKWSKQNVSDAIKETAARG